MRRSTRISSIAAAGLLLVSLAALPVKASSEEERPGEIGVLAGIGMTDANLVGNDNNTSVNPLLGLRLAWHFGEAIALFGEGTWIKYDGEPTLFGDVDEFAGRLGPEFYLNPRASWQFFVNAGVGGEQLKTDFGGDDARPFASVGLGIRRGWQPGAFRLELRGDRTVSSGGTLGPKDFNALKVNAGWTFGIGPRPRDTDGDGVFDKKDRCPNTPRGAVVDDDGCPKDGDGDGVPDGIDKCPDTPRGWPVDATGCPTDSDGDGVADGADKCPDTVPGCATDSDGCPGDEDADGICDGLDKCAQTLKGCRVSSTGCPVDSDRDGVCDGIDRCPGTPAGAQVDAKGCPPPPPPPPPPPTFIPEPKKELVLERVFFETDSARLKPESAATLDKVAASLKGFPDVKIQVAGHTDSSGSDAHNLKLSDARATSVMNYLISKGVPPANLSAKGYGEAEPVADNKTKDGKSQNRRVGLRRME